MADQNSIRVITAAKPGRKRENLSVLLGSFFQESRIILVDNSQDALAHISQEEPVIVLFDHSIPVLEIEKGIESIRNINPRVWVIALLLHPYEKGPFSLYQPDGVIYDSCFIAGMTKLIQALNDSAQQ